MHIFVASWFFPPVTSSEGIVTYKLLRNSKFQYDVYSSTSQKWSYQVGMERLEEENIHASTIETDSIDEWVEGAVEEFERLYPVAHYDCVMSRSTPPESILIGARIKQRHPEVKWIASMGDPVANNPYEIFSYVESSPTLTSQQKGKLKAALQDGTPEQLEKWADHAEQGIRLLCKLKKWENIVLEKADLIICPTAIQLRYITRDRSWRPKYFPLPHSFDKAFYGPECSPDSDKIVFSYIGYSDTLRSLEPFVRAVRLLRQKGVPELSRLEIRFIGNHPQHIRDMILNYQLDDVIHLKGGVNYYESLRLMQESDWLLHVDTFFPEIETGGSVFFPGKLADYMGAGKPIFSLTGEGSPADEITKLSGGISLRQWEIPKIAEMIEEILLRDERRSPNKKYTDRYDAIQVSAQFDERVKSMFRSSRKITRTRWAEMPPVSREKLISICVPSYNVDQYLDRCLHSLVDQPLAGKTEILVIDDGSADRTAEIGTIYEQRYPGIVRLIQKENGGHGSTINRALKEAAGRFFMVVDGDDWVNSKDFCRLIQDIDENKIDSDLISSDYVQIDMETSQESIIKQEVEVKYFKEMKFKELDLKNVYFTLASSLIRTEVLRKTGMQLQEHTFYVDVEYILFPVPYVNTVTFVDYNIYRYYRGNAEQSVYLPTMVKRYSHHERVMRSVVQYREKTTMLPEQLQYYDAILKRLLYTHYALFMVYNEDKEAGFAQGKKFDDFLCSTCPYLAKWVAGNIPLVRLARRKKFDYVAVQHSFGIHFSRFGSACKNRLKRLVYRVARWRITRKIIYNKMTIAIGKNEFFENGKGQKLKLRLRRYIES